MNLWTADKYFAKAKRYWQNASGRPRDSDDFLIQVSFFLEFLVRGCLVFRHPVLNSDVSEDGIIYSVGLAPEKPPRTIELSTALKRLNRLIPEITEHENSKIRALFNARNLELHGDGDDIAALKELDVVPSVYCFAVRLSEFANLDLNVLLGTEEARQATAIFSASQKDRKKRVSDLIKIHKDRFFSSSEDVQIKAREAGKPDFASAVTKSGHHIRAVKCPSCAAIGLLAGVPVGQSGPILRDDGIYKEIRVQPEVFQCKCCELKIKGLDELMAAGFGHEFHTLDNIDVIEYFGIDPMDYVDTEEIIREYQRDMYEYQDE